MSIVLTTNIKLKSKHDYSTLYQVRFPNACVNYTDSYLSRK